MDFFQAANGTAEQFDYKKSDQKAMELWPMIKASPSCPAPAVVNGTKIKMKLSYGALRKLTKRYSRPLMMKLVTKEP